MFHYTYMVSYTDGKRYIGVRTSQVEPDQDSAYIGSSEFTPNDKVIRKEILGIFSSREEAVRHEIDLHEEWDVARSGDFYNRSKQTSHKFDTSGVNLERSQEHNEKIKAALTGRKRSYRERMSISKAKTGKSNGPHSEETRMKISQSNKGKPNHMQGKTYKPEEHLRQYASRQKYSDTYPWINESTGEMLEATCMEMGLKYGAGAKPTQRFRDIVKPGARNKSYKGWRLNNEAQTSECA